jgi:hypothetical protein
MTKRKRKNVDEKLLIALVVVPPLALIGLVVFAFAQHEYVTKAAKKKRELEQGGWA